MTEVRARKRRRILTPEPGPYILRKVLEDIPLQTDDGPESVSITCVEYWNDNLYIGTSASEILHLVALPAESEQDPPQYILASRLEPSGHALGKEPGAVGVQQILVLPGPLKACVLCNGTASFYSLPELSPAFPSSQPNGVHWIGGVDENGGRENPESVIVMIATAKRIMQVRIGERLKRVNNIEYPACLKASRRDTIACVADDKSYALLETEHQQKIPLFEVSSSPELQSQDGRSLELLDETKNDPRNGTSGNTATTQPHDDGNLARTDARPFSPAHNISNEVLEVPEAPSINKSSARSSSRRQLKPHILSPSANEFMLTTGTTISEPGVGVFVNLDGDVSRGTLEFEHYPHAVIAYSFPAVNGAVNEADNEEVADFVIALLVNTSEIHPRLSLEIVGIADNSDLAIERARLPLPEQPQESGGLNVGLSVCLSTQRFVHSEIIDLLRAVRFQPSVGAALDSTTRDNVSNEDKKRTAEELQLVSRLASSSTKALIWSHTYLWQLLPNPIILQLEAQILAADVAQEDEYTFERINVSKIISLLGSLRQREPTDELEYRTFSYIRQKSSIVLYIHMLSNLNAHANIDSACRIVDSALQESGIDPRIVLLLLGTLSTEVVSGKDNIWLPQGIVECLTQATSTMKRFEDAPLPFWLMLWHYLASWQDKRGFGSINDEEAVFDSVDGALLHLLLYLDQSLPRGDEQQVAVGTKLNHVVDHWSGDFDRAVALLEKYHRLFVLSRLYQSRKSSRDVLRTWKRICEGEKDGDESVDTANVLVQVRKYLTVIRDTSLVQEYAIWLAQRSPDLAVQALSDEHSRVKFAPTEVVSLLKKHAPSSVQLFLEHLVFGKNLDQYADDLVGYYLDSVLNVLESSEEARQSLAETYSTYRALESPKPTYLNFITENTPDKPWWRSRLRLLQLLGSGGYATSGTTGKELTYSIDMVLERLQPYSSYLVSESIILDARQGRHNEALKLLVHGLGDFDTAVRYCYFGGPSSPSGTIDVSLLPSREEQRGMFTVLFDEFLQIDDLEEKMERTSHLLGTFATWFDPIAVLNRIPDDWSINMLGEFLLRTLRCATSERNQAVIIKALSAAQNLQKQAEFIEICEKIGARVETAEGQQAEDEIVSNS